MLSPIGGLRRDLLDPEFANGPKKHEVESRGEPLLNEVGGEDFLELER